MVTSVILYNMFNNSVDKFLKHVGNIVHQYEAITNLKANKQNEIVVHIDFSENFQLKLSEEIQAFHFGGSRQQISLHTGVLYKSVDGETRSFPFCSLSENLRHDAYTVRAHLIPVFHWVKSLTNDQIDTIHVLSDGPTAQYRNKTMFHIISQHCREIMTGLSCMTWNYSEAGHGKGAPDGIGGTLKRIADQAVAEGRDIDSFLKLIKILEDRCKGVKLFTVPHNNIEEFENKISPITEAFKGTLKVHQVVFLNNVSCLYFNSLSCFKCIENETFKKCIHYNIGEGFMKELDKTPVILNVSNNGNVNDTSDNQQVKPGCWVAVIYDDNWFLGVVESKDCNMITVNFMKVVGPNRFIWPEKKDVDKINSKGILTVINENPEILSYTGRAIHSLPSREYERIVDLFMSIS